MTPIKQLHTTIVDKELILNKLLSHEGNKKSFSYKRWLPYAAVGILFISLGYKLLFPTHKITEQQMNEDAITLQLSDKSIKNLGPDGTLTFETPSGVQVEQYGDTIMYKPTSNSTAEMAYNQIYVPYGKTSVLVLSDDTRIVLNSGTKIKFPESFKLKGNREVAVEGEAFFQVAKDADRPFIVNSGEVFIRVLGTEFNVNSYRDNGAVETVLIEGKVALYTNQNGYGDLASVRLDPGMKGSFNEGSEGFQVENVNVSTYIAWLKGELIFEKEMFSAIAKVLERSFNVKIHFENEAIQNQKFVAKFQGESITQILESMKQSYDFEYVINDDDIYIKSVINNLN